MRLWTIWNFQGLYYSYFKTLVNSPKFSQGLSSIINDNVTEFGHTINTLKRFNLYPEVWLYYDIVMLNILMIVFFLACQWRFVHNVYENSRRVQNPNTTMLENGPWTRPRTYRQLWRFLFHESYFLIFYNLIYF